MNFTNLIDKFHAGNARDQTYFARFTRAQLHAASTYKKGLTNMPQAATDVLAEGPLSGEEMSALLLALRAKERESSYTPGSLLESLIKKNQPLEVDFTQPTPKVTYGVGEKKVVSLGAFPSEEASRPATSVLLAPVASFTTQEKGKIVNAMNKSELFDGFAFDFVQFPAVASFITTFGEMMEQYNTVNNIMTTQSGKTYLASLIQFMAGIDEQAHVFLCDQYVRTIMGGIYRWATNSRNERFIAGLNPEFARRYPDKELDKLVTKVVVAGRAYYIPLCPIPGEGRIVKLAKSFRVAQGQLSGHRNFRGTDDKGPSVMGLGYGTVANVDRQTRAVVRILKIVHGIHLARGAKKIHIIGEKMGGILPSLGASVQKLAPELEVSYKPTGFGFTPYAGLTPNITAPDGAVKVVFVNIPESHSQVPEDFEKAMWSPIDLVRNIEGKDCVIVTKVLSDTVFKHYDVYPNGSFHAFDGILVPKGTKMGLATKLPGKEVSLEKISPMSKEEALTKNHDDNVVKNFAWKRPIFGRDHGINLYVPIKMAEEIWDITAKFDDQVDWMDEDIDPSAFQGAELQVNKKKKKSSAPSQSPVPSGSSAPSVIMTSLSLPPSIPVQVGPPIAAQSSLPQGIGSSVPPSPPPFVFMANQTSAAPSKTSEVVALTTTTAPLPSPSLPPPVPVKPTIPPSAAVPSDPVGTSQTLSVLFEKVDDDSV